MRSHSSHSSHRSSLSSRNHSSMHRSSMHSSSLHGSMHRSRLHKSSIRTGGINKSPLKHHGKSNAHAFAVGKATGVNINGSALGAHGAALHRFERMRKMSKDSRTRHNRMVSSFSKRNRGTNFNNKKSTDDFIRRMRVSRNKHRYTSQKYDYSQFNNINNEINKFNDKINNVVNEYGKYIWIPILAFIIIFLLMSITLIIFITNMFFIK